MGPRPSIQRRDSNSDDGFLDAVTDLSRFSDRQLVVQVAASDTVVDAVHGALALPEGRISRFGPSLVALVLANAWSTRVVALEL